MGAIGANMGLEKQKYELRQYINEIAKQRLLNRAAARTRKDPAILDDGTHIAGLPNYDWVAKLNAMDDEPSVCKRTEYTFQEADPQFGPDAVFKDQDLPGEFKGCT